jgi:hypothetical protein
MPRLTDAFRHKCLTYDLTETARVLAMSEPRTSEQAIGLVPVGWFDNRPEAELAQARLTDAGIGSAIDNGTLVGWFWQLSNAVGGIKLSVESADLAAAREILADNIDDRSEPRPTCPNCQAELERGWEECWRCADQQPAEPSDASQTAPESSTHFEESWERLLVGSAVAAAGLFFYRHWRLGGLAVWIGCLAVAQLLTRRSADVAEASAETTALVDTDEPTHARRNDLIERVAQKAWWSAMLGMIWFPPLSFYAFWLTRRLDPRRFPLSRWARRRRTAALWAITVTVLFWVLVVAIVYGTSQWPSSSHPEAEPWPITR